MANVDLTDSQSTGPEKPKPLKAKQRFFKNTNTRATGDDIVIPSTPVPAPDLDTPGHDTVGMGGRYNEEYADEEYVDLDENLEDLDDDDDSILANSLAEAEANIEEEVTESTPIPSKRKSEKSPAPSPSKPKDKRSKVPSPSDVIGAGHATRRKVFPNTDLNISNLLNTTESMSEIPPMAPLVDKPILTPDDIRENMKILNGNIEYHAISTRRITNLFMTLQEGQNEANKIAIGQQKSHQRLVKQTVDNLKATEDLKKIMQEYQS